MANRTMKTLIITLAILVVATVGFAQKHDKPDTTTYIKGWDDGMNYRVQKMPVFDTVECYFAIDPNNGKLKGKANLIWYYGYAVTKYEKPIFYLDKNKNEFKNQVILNPIIR